MISTLAETVDAPYNEFYAQFPTMMMEYGRGGGFGWGTLCGALTAAGAVIGLVCDKDQARQAWNEVCAWYIQFPFPAYQPAGLNLITTVSESTLCHVSVTRWCKAAGLPRDSEERSERCGGLTADVAKFTAEVLNKILVDQDFTPAYTYPAVVDSCMDCHKETIGRDDCTVCHTAEAEPHW